MVQKKDNSLYLRVWDQTRLSGGKR